MGCKDMSALYLNALNGIMLIGSIVILAFSAYLTSQLGDFSEVVDEGAIVTPMVFACFFFVVSVLGVCAVRKKNKCLLMLYLVFSSIITIAVFSSGAVVLSFSGLVEDIGSDTVVDASGSVEARVIDFELAVFQVCCVDAFAATAPALCVGNDPEACISDQERFDSFVEGIPQDICNLLDDVDFNGAPLVGDPADGSCAAGSAPDFVAGLSEFIVDNIKPFGITSVVLSVVMLMDLIATCVLLWSKKEDYGYEKKQKKQEEKYADQAAPEMAGEAVKY